MKVYTIQSKDLTISERVFPDPSRCNHPNAKECYKRLFADYNKKFGTNYSGFFWGFSRLLVEPNLNDVLHRMTEMCCSCKGRMFYVLDVPDELVLQTDFYNFSDEIYASECPGEFKHSWEDIYKDRGQEMQCIFPYLEKSWIRFKMDLDAQKASEIVHNVSLRSYSDLTGALDAKVISVF